jgi:hypothetical protein
MYCVLRDVAGRRGHYREGPWHRLALSCTYLPRPLPCFAKTGKDRQFSIHARRKTRGWMRLYTTLHYAGLDRLPPNACLARPQGPPIVRQGEEQTGLPLIPPPELGAAVHVHLGGPERGHEGHEHAGLDLHVVQSR